MFFFYVYLIMPYCEYGVGVTVYTQERKYIQCQFTSSKIFMKYLQYTTKPTLQSLCILTLQYQTMYLVM